MKEPLLIAISPSKLDVIHLRGGLLHPRWPLLSALLTMLSGCVGYMLWHFVPCLSGFLSFFCEASIWSFWVQIVLIDLVFLLGWVSVFVLGYVSLEAPRRPRSRLKEFFRSISDARLIGQLLAFYGVLILLGMVAIIVLWLWHHVRVQPVPLALAIVVLLTAAWTWVYQFLCRRRLIKEKELGPVINSMISRWYLLRCLPLIRRIAQFLGNDRVKCGTIVAGMQSLDQTDTQSEDAR